MHYVFSYFFRVFLCITLFGLLYTQSVRPSNYFSELVVGDDQQSWSPEVVAAGVSIGGGRYS